MNKCGSLTETVTKTNCKADVHFANEINFTIFEGIRKIICKLFSQLAKSPLESCVYTFFSSNFRNSIFRKNTSLGDGMFKKIIPIATSRYQLYRTAMFNVLSSFVSLHKGTILGNKMFGTRMPKIEVTSKSYVWERWIQSVRKIFSLF